MRLILALLLAGAVTAVRAQPSTTTLTVRVLDSYDRAPVPQATVEFLRDGAVFHTAATDADGRASFTIDRTGTEQPERFGAGLTAPFPNPTRGRTQLSFSVDRAATLEARVFDVLGREVVDPARWPVTSGTYALEIGLDQLGAGTYLVRVLADGTDLGTARVVRVGDARASGAPSIRLRPAGEAGLPPLRAARSAVEYAVRVTKAGYEPDTYAVNPSSAEERVVLLDRITQEAVSAEIGAEGGLVAVTNPESPIAGAYVEVPPGALRQSSTVVIRAAEAEGVPDGFQIVALEAGQPRFDTPVEIGIPYAGGTDPAALGLFFYDEGGSGWVAVEAKRIDPDARLMVADTDRPGLWGVLPCDRYPCLEPAAPALAAPEQGATVEPPVTLRWNPVPGALAYHYQHGVSEGFEADSINSERESLDTTAVELSGYLRDRSRRYYWRVRGIFTSGPGEWSEVRSYTVPAAGGGSDPVNTIGMEFVRIPAGTFRMGDVAGGGDPNELPVHEVTISRDYYLGKHEVTQAQWEAVMGTRPSYFGFCGEDCPVEQVSWNEVQAFIQKLNEREGVNVYRLPTEAEWEYAARAGTETTWSFGSEESLLGEHAWYAANSGGRTHPVGRKLPNPWGLYDVHGNVWEWVQDWLGDYPDVAQADPQGATTGTRRVLRGGSWRYVAELSRTANRNSDPPGVRNLDIGFRLLRKAL